MDQSNSTTILCLVIFFIIGVTVAPYLLARRGKINVSFKLLRKSTYTSGNPIQIEKQKLEELSRRITELKVQDETNSGSGNIQE
jgi:hypothetical protein